MGEPRDDRVYLGNVGRVPAARIDLTAVEKRLYLDRQEFALDQRDKRHGRT